MATKNNDDDGMAVDNDQAQKDQMRKKVDDAWGEFLRGRTKGLTLSSVTLDTSDFEQLKQKWEELRSTKGRGATNNKNIGSISFRRCQLSGDVVAPVARFLQATGPNLVCVEETTADCLVSILDAVTAATAAPLQRMRLRRIDLRNRGETLERLLAHRDCTIREIDFSFCRLNNNMVKGFLSGLHKHRQGLRCLELNHCELVNAQFNALVNTILAGTGGPTKNTLVRLSLTFLFRLTSDAFPSLTRLVAGCSALQEIQLCSCGQLFETVTLGAAFSTFKDTLAKNTSLVSLNLQRCQVTDQLVIPLLEALSASPTLRRLNLANTPITEEALHAVVKFLKNNKTIQELWLGGCQNLCLDPREGLFASFAQTLKLNSSLKELHLDGCGVTDEFAALILAALEENNTLERLDILQVGVELLGDTCLTKLKGLAFLRVFRVTFESPRPDTTPPFYKNTSLLEILSGGREQPEHVHVALRRNNLLHKALPKISALGANLLPFCFDYLARECPDDSTPVYQLVLKSFASARL